MNKIFNLRNVVAIAICLAGFTMFSSCDKDKGKISGKFRFSGTPTTKSATAKSLLKSGEEQETVQGAEQYELLYSKLGTKKGTITPTMLELSIKGIYVWGSMEGETTSLFYSVLEGGLVDLAKPIIINMGDIEPGNYNHINMAFSTIGGGGTETFTSRVRFRKPADFDILSHIFYREEGNIVEDGNNLTFDLYILDPYFVNGIWSDGYEPKVENIGFLGSVFMCGNKRRVLFNETVYWDEIMPGYPHSIMFENNGDHSAIIAPFKGITVPENAKSVRFEVVWDIKDIIEVYEGKTSSPNDDIFVLKNKFWEGFSVEAFIEY